MQTGDDITSVGFDSFCNDFALTDKDGTILTPVRCYRDKRTERHLKEFEGVMAPTELYMINGNQRGLFNTLPQLFAMIKDGQGWMLDRCDKAVFVSDLFVWLLTGKKITEYTTASVTQLFDYDKQDWAAEVFERYKIRKDLFAPIVMPGTVVGRTKSEINHAFNTKGMFVTTVCQHDTASAFISSIGDGNHAIISAGTWSVIGCETEHPIIKKQGFKFNIANEGGYRGHHRILRNVMGTWILQEIVREERQKGTDIDFIKLDALAQEFPEPECAVDVDEIQFYSPGNMLKKAEDYWLKHAGRKPVSLGECVSGIYTGLVYKYRFTIEKLEEFTGRKFTSVNIVGGGAKSSLMCQRIADICGLPVDAGPFDATAYGNVLVQMIAFGAVSSIDEGRRLIRRSCRIKRYEPSVNNNDEKYRAFIEHTHI